MKLFFDTETTGKFDFKAQPHADHQPRMVQLAALLTNDEGLELGQMNVIIRPEGFTIPDEVAALHGITQAIAESAGVQCKQARRLFREFWQVADLAVAHNISFDMGIIDGEMYRAATGIVKWGKPLNTVCTMKAMTPLCKLPGQFGDFKWPKLQEAYRHAFGCEFLDAHNAMADVRACKEVYFWLRHQHEEQPTPKTP